jgi:anthranilate synthase component 1
LNILIRTLLYENNRVSFRAGGGIVHDSVPQRELMETRHKAQGLLNAIEVHA